jgi:methionyl-tRNA formyltransferase
MAELRVAFFGSPDFAVPTLEALIDSPYRPTVVVTQPDRRAGRGRALRPPPVKVAAAAAGIAVLQPDRLREPEATAALAAFQPDLQLIVAYGQILRPDVLALPRFGTLNVHASLLPRWRGAAPVAAAIRAGDHESGVTIMLVDEGEDSGDMLTSRMEPIQDDDDAGSLGDRLSAQGASLLLETIPRWLSGEITPEKQDPGSVTRARRLTKEDGVIDWTQPAEAIWRQVRALSPWPGATTSLSGTRIRVWRAEVSNAEDTGSSGDRAVTPGTVVDCGDSMSVQTGDGILHVRTIQRAGKRAMDAGAFSRGERALLGARLGASETEIV